MTPHSISASELRKRMGVGLDRVYEGEELLVTRRGKTIARLIAVQPVLSSHLESTLPSPASGGGNVSLENETQSEEKQEN